MERGETENARRLAGAVLSFLVLVGVVGCTLGVVFAPALTRAVAFGFDQRTHQLATTLVRILFPMAGLLILAAWCLGVLNTNRRFFIAYAAPTLWNIAQIATLIAFGGILTGADLVTALAWGALGGTFLHLLVQVPATLRYTRGIHWTLNPRVPGLSRVMRAWVPVIAGAGAMQISSLIDLQLASLLGAGSVANLGYAQLIGILPVSLFGISVAAASLPELSRDAAMTDTAQLRQRVAHGVRRVLFFVVPSAAAFIFIGDHVVGLVLQTGAFDSAQTSAVARVLAGIGVGLPASSLIKLLASGHYALGDTRTPVRIALISVTLGAVAAYVLMQRLGVLGIVLGGSAGAYVNVLFNYRALSRKVGGILSGTEWRWIALGFAAAIIATIAGLLIASVVTLETVWLAALAVLVAFGAAYLSVTALPGHPDAQLR